jgi:hypothetical protein
MLAQPAMLKAALAYARRGIPVFPCKPGGKEPLTRNGHLDATTDPSRIHAWWNRWPNANIAMPTGARSRVWVLDEDPDRGGTNTLRALEAEHGCAVPATTRAKTGGDGTHHYLAWSDDDEEIRNSTDKVGPGLDVRGEGAGRGEWPPSSLDRRAEVLAAFRGHRAVCGVLQRPQPEGTPAQG